MCWMKHPHEQLCLLSLAMPWNTQWREPHPLMNQVQKAELYQYHLGMQCAQTTQLRGKGDRRQKWTTSFSCPFFLSCDALQQLLQAHSYVHVLHWYLYIVPSSATSTDEPGTKAKRYYYNYDMLCVQTECSKACISCCRTLQLSEKGDRRQKSQHFLLSFFPELWCPAATVTSLTSSQTCTELILVTLQVKCLLSFHATTLAPSSPMDVTVPVSPLPPSVTDCTSHGTCVLPALHHTSSKLAFVVYLQILATALAVMGVFCIFGYCECTHVPGAPVVSAAHILHYNPQIMD